ncbi:MAG: CBS domain-containing protein [Dichotomicrobium sp.]
MNVASILKHKGRDCATIHPERPISEAVRILAERRIGALVVVDDAGDIAGILSERDIVVNLANGQKAVLDAPVSRIMTRDVFTCTPSDTTDQLMAQMTNSRIRHLPVKENGKLAGIISIGDVVKWRIAEVESREEALREYIATG